MLAPGTCGNRPRGALRIPGVSEFRLGTGGLECFCLLMLFKYGYCTLRGNMQLSPGTVAAWTMPRAVLEEREGLQSPGLRQAAQVLGCLSGSCTYLCVAPTARCCVCPLVGCWVRDVVQTL